MQRLVASMCPSWDIVCIAAIHAFDVGRRAVWAVLHRLNVPVFVEQVAVRAAVDAFWDALADFAATARVPCRYMKQLLTRQLFVAWHTVLRGNGR